MPSGGVSAACSVPHNAHIRTTVAHDYDDNPPDKDAVINVGSCDTTAHADDTNP